MIKKSAALAVGAVALGRTAAAAKNVSAAATVHAHVDPGERVRIHPTVYGANNEWRAVTSEEFPAFNSKLHDYGHQLLRFPGGWESEWYDWHTDTTQDDWGGTPDEPGATGAQAANAANHPAFVLRTNKYIADPTPAKRAELIEQARTAVNKHGNRVKHWMIGNEWWLQWGGGATRSDRRYRYAVLARAIAREIKQLQPAAAVYVTGLWTQPTDFTAIKEVFDANGSWGNVDGVDLHLYVGDNHSDEDYREIISNLGAIKQASGKSKIIVSEWAFTRNRTGGKEALVSVNGMVITMHTMMWAGVTAASYWPAPDGKAPGIGLTYMNSAGWHDLPHGQAFRWMANSMTGYAARTTGDLETAAAVNPDRNRITVLIPSRDLANTNVRVHFAGTTIVSVVRGDALWMSDPTQRKTAANTAPVNPAFNDGDNFVDVIANPGGPGRGSSHELLRLIVNYR